MSRKEDKQMGPLSPSTGPNKDVAPRTSKAAAGTAAGAKAGAGTGSMNPKLKGGKAKPKSVSRVNKASTSDVSYEQMKNYPCRRMKLKLKAAGQQLVYDDMCSLAKRQAAKRGFFFVGRNGTGPGVPSGEAVPDAMWPASGGGAKLNAVIEKLERQVRDLSYLRNAQMWAKGGGNAVYTASVCGSGANTDALHDQHTYP